MFPDLIIKLYIGFLVDTVKGRSSKLFMIIILAMTMLQTRKYVPSLCQDPAGSRNVRRQPGHRKETQTTVVWTCLPFIRSGQNHFATDSERGKKTRRTKEEVGRQHQGMDRPGVRQVPEGGGEQGKMEKNWLRNHLWCPNDSRG